MELCRGFEERQFSITSNSVISYLKHGLVMIQKNLNFILEYYSTVITIIHKNYVLHCFNINAEEERREHCNIEEFLKYDGRDTRRESFNDLLRITAYKIKEFVYQFLVFFLNRY